MKKVALLVAGLVLFSIPLFAGEYLMNDTGATVYGLRVVFSEPVTLAGFGDVLMTVKPVGESTEFVFFGGELGSWAGHWFNWEPASALLMNHEWLTDPATVETSASDWAAYEASRPFWERNPNPTYEEIMAEIAEYPGPEEPLYEPAPDEAIWLTDLEGHADIYDNDSIKINYADWYDQNQITKIEVYRNGIKMLFLPDLFVVLTNEQMKTFDGNPLEHSPASSHTDHAIMGYVYEVRLTTSPGITRKLAATVKSRVRFSPAHRFASIGATWFNPFTRGYMTERQVAEYVRGIKTDGFNGIQIDITLWSDGLKSNDVFPIFPEEAERNPDLINPWLATVPDTVLESMLRIAGEEGLEREVRVHVYITDEYKREHPGAWRGNLAPANATDWWQNYTEKIMHYVRIAERSGVELFCPMVELDTMQQDREEVIALLDETQRVFSGHLVVSEATCSILSGWTLGGIHLGSFWDYDDLRIGMNSWVIPLEDDRDQHLTHIVQSFVEFWKGAVDTYRDSFPGHLILFDEIGFYNYDGSLTVAENPTISEQDAVRDDQEMADFWAAVYIGAASLNLDGICMYFYEMAYPQTRARWSAVDTSTSRLIFLAFAQ
jgi:hypothetical protein